jgi:hypothetical protein
LICLVVLTVHDQEQAMKPSTKSHPPIERIHDVPRILHAMKQGVRKALARHREQGNPIAVWRDGRVVWIPAEEIPVELTEPLPEFEPAD